MTPAKTDKNPRGAGRPAKPPGEKYKGHHIKFLPGEWQKIQQRAAAKGISASEYVRSKALQE